MRLIDADELENKGFKFETYGGETYIALGSVRTAPTIDPEELRPKGELDCEEYEEALRMLHKTGVE